MFHSADVTKQQLRWTNIYRKDKHKYLKNPGASFFSFKNLRLLTICTISTFTYNILRCTKQYFYKKK